MSILHIALGITEPSTLWMRRQLDMIGDEVSYIFTDIHGAKAYREKYKCSIILRSHNKLLNKMLHLYNVARLYAIVHRKKVHTIYIHYATTAVLYKRVIHSTRKKVFVHCHGYDVTWNYKLSGLPMHSKNYVEHIRNMPGNVTFISNSKITLKRLLDVGIPQKRTILKYLGVEVPKKLPERIYNEKMIVLFLGRLVDFKGPDLVIRAFEKSCHDGFKGTLIIAGDGPLYSTCELLRAHSPFHDRIKLLGAVDANTGLNLRRNADIFTAHNCTGPLSGQEEAFGVSIIEAMAEGLPIVNARNGSIPELLEDDISAILVKPGDINAHATGLLRLQNDPEFRMKISVNAWKRVRDNFSLDKEHEKLRKILGI